MNKLAEPIVKETHCKGMVIWRRAQRIIIFKSFVLDIDCTAYPMHVVLVDWEDHDIF